MTHKDPVPLHRYLTARFRLESSGDRLALTVLVILAVAGIVKGIDRAFSEPSSSDLMYVVEMLGSHVWGWAHAIASLLILVAVATRWLAGMIAATAAAAAVWAAYATAMTQGVATAFIAGDLRGVRFAAAPLETAALMLVMLAALLAQHRRLVKDGGAR
ncbi:hypothetical protein [Sediminivirga luteola]|uniref:Uncharacterized protein n=1 Tax=Sediminivirga luteola TaxID=1774748 RepID=A0A8J2TX07_9MICO|nr:hypothetical protein [Sediminivirga luteola]GGA10601.1 hypothetical protein GCM10011333_11750 [Sediminivirga luteola]